MSEFKFACPVCGQHITAASSASGTHLECPTCFRKIVVPQAPASDATKFILSAAQADKPRPPGASAATEWGPRERATTSNPWVAVSLTLSVLLAASAAVYWWRDRLFKPARAPLRQGALAGAEKAAEPRTVYPVPTNILWSLDLTNAAIPEATVAGSLHGEGFRGERAILTGGNLFLRQGRGKMADLSLNVAFFAQQGEELSGRNLNVQPDRAPPLPKVTVRWKDEQQQQKSERIDAGYLLKISFGQATNGRMPGRFYLALPDSHRSVVAGLFEAEIRKPLPPKPKQPPKAGK